MHPHEHTQTTQFSNYYMGYKHSSFTDFFLTGMFNKTIVATKVTYFWY